MAGKSKIIKRNIKILDFCFLREMSVFFSVTLGRDEEKIESQVAGKKMVFC